MATYWGDEFLLAIEEHVPEAITALRDDIAPLYANVSENVFGVQGIESIYPNPNADDWQYEMEPSHRFTQRWGGETSASTLVDNLRDRLDGGSRASRQILPTAPGRDAKFWNTHRAEIESFIEAFDDWRTEFGMTEPWLGDYALWCLHTWRDSQTTEDGWPILEWAPDEEKPRWPSWAPWRESRAAYVERLEELARGYCDSVQRAMGTESPKRARKRVARGAENDDRARHMRWFVSVQVGGRRPSEVAKVEQVSAQTVRLANKQTADDIGINDEHRRLFPPGPPLR